MYQTVFVSVAGAVLLLKLIFIVASILFTIKYQDSPRSSISSADTTTVSIDTNYDSPGTSGRHEDTARLGRTTTEGKDKDQDHRTGGSSKEHGHDICSIEGCSSFNRHNCSSTYPHVLFFDALMQSNDDQYYADTSI